jgi:hypothetical protein
MPTTRSTPSTSPSRVAAWCPATPRRACRSSGVSPAR